MSFYDKYDALSKNLQYVESFFWWLRIDIKMNLSTLLLGCIVSFLGQLPIGSINLIATQIGVNEKLKDGIAFSIGIAVVEIIYVRIILATLGFVNIDKAYFNYAKFLAAAILFYLAYNSYKLYKEQLNFKSSLETLYKNKLVYGFFLSAVNVAQFPFWIIWITYCINKNYLANNFDSFNFFTLGTGVGTIAGLLIYYFIGKFFISKFKKITQHLQLFIALFFCIAGLLILFSFHTNS